MKPLLNAQQIAEQKGLLLIKKTQRTNENWVPLGYALGPHGVKGAIKLHLDNSESLSIYEGASIGFSLKSGDLVVLKVISIKKGYRISFENITDRDEAEAFKGAALFVKREQMPELADDEVYLVDLLGAKAIDTDGNPLGEVTGFSDNRAQHLVEIKTAQGKKVLLPFIHPILQKIDEKNHLIVFDPPLGFFNEI